jgi:hypothetical protein
MRKSWSLSLLCILIGLTPACSRETNCLDGIDDDCDGLVDLEDDDCELGCVAESTCCKVCESGTACGDTCIDSSDTCNTTGGCACDPEDVCTSADYPVQDPTIDPFAECDDESLNQIRLVDVLFVIDNSQSMVDESAALALAVSSLVEAVDENYQLGITTTTAKLIGGESAGLEPGEGGWLLGDPIIISSKRDPDVEGAFRRTLLCSATYWDEDEVPSDLAYVCGTEPEQITQEYLDCECGFGDWEGNAGSGDEEPLEAALLAMCRSVASPPEACFEGDAEHTFTDNDISTNNTDDRQLLRDGASTVIVIIGDEGDDSWRLSEGEESPDVYSAAFSAFERPIQVVAFGPGYNADDGTFPCNSGGAQTWMVERLQTMTEATGGFYAPLEEQVDGECVQADFSSMLANLAALVNAQ